MSIVHSCEETQTAKRVSGGEPGRLSSRQIRSLAAAADPRHAGRDRLVRDLDALRAEHLREELAEHDRLAVGHEVDTAGGCLGRGQP